VARFAEQSEGERGSSSALSAMGDHDGEGSPGREFRVRPAGRLEKTWRAESPAGVSPRGFPVVRLRIPRGDARGPGGVAVDGCVPMSMSSRSVEQRRQPLPGPRARFSSGFARRPLRSGMTGMSEGPGDERHLHDPRPATAATMNTAIPPGRTMPRDSPLGRVERGGYGMGPWGRGFAGCVSPWGLAGRDASSPSPLAGEGAPEGADEGWSRPFRISRGGHYGDRSATPHPSRLRRATFSRKGRRDPAPRP
jgi:hypothetical protein